MYITSNYIALLQRQSYGDFGLNPFVAGFSCASNGGLYCLNTNTGFTLSVSFATYTRDAINMISETQSIRCICYCGHLSSYNEGGITCEACYLYLDNTFWSFATIRCYLYS